MNQIMQKKIIFALIIISLVFLGLSQLLSWAEVQQNDENVISFYSWGGHAHKEFFTSNKIFLYLNLASEYSDFSKNVPPGEALDFIKSVVVANIFLFVITILNFIAIIFTFLALDNCNKNKLKKEQSWSLSAGLTIAITCIIYYIITIFILFDSVDTSVYCANLLGSTPSCGLIESPGVTSYYGAGFYLFLVSGILLCVIGLRKYFVSEDYGNVKS